MSEPETTDQPSKKSIDPEATFQYLKSQITKLTELELKINNKLLENKNLDFNIIRVNKDTMKIINEALSNIIKAKHPDGIQFNDLIYCTASIIAGEHKQRDGNTNRKEPAWKVRLRSKNEQYRKDLSIICEIKKGVAIKVHNKAKQILSNNEFKSIAQVEHDLKMK